MACNENVIKNMANEITRNCQAENVAVDTEFVVYLIELLLLNPKYGKLFSQTINRNNLEYFVKECVAMLIRNETPINTLKMQFTMRTSYDNIRNLIDKHLHSIEDCLSPLINEILEEDPDLEDDAAFRKLFRKISIYIILSSGLGNPGSIVTLKEGMAALESVFSMDDLKVFVAFPRCEKMAQLDEIMQITSGVRLFNRDCKQGGEGIPDLPFKLVDAGKACVATLSKSLIAVMQKVNWLTAAVAGLIAVHEDTGNVYVDIPDDSELDESEYQQVWAALSLCRQHEAHARRLLAAAGGAAARGGAALARVRRALHALHAALRHKAAVPVLTVFPLFKNLWEIWRSMQNLMFVMSTINKVMTTLSGIYEKTPDTKLDKMLRGRSVQTDVEMVHSEVSMAERVSVGSLESHHAFTDTFDKHVQFLGFCALCLSIGVLIPSNIKVGLIKYKGLHYGFCNVKMATRFSKNPQRYINEILDFARNNPHIINLLNIMEDVERVKDIENIVTVYVPKTKIEDKEIQTDVHPIEEHIERDYVWDMWEWKRRACQWATIVNCQTHSTQTNYSHLRSDTYSQTVFPRDKCLQTKKDISINTNPREGFLWGVRGRRGLGQHRMELSQETHVNRTKAQIFTTCEWPCIKLDENNTIKQKML